MAQLSIGIRPLGDKVIVRPNQQAEVSNGGIIIPTVAQDAPTVGTVVAVGPGRIDGNGNRIEPDVKYGDTVMYSSRAGSDLKHKDKTYRLMSASDIQCVIEG